MDPRSLATRIGELQIIDVRQPHEWEAGHIESAVNIPEGDLPARMGEIDPGRPAVAVCLSGGRSARAVAVLRSRGFDVEDLEGGMQAWVAAGLDYRAAGGGPGRLADREAPGAPAKPPAKVDIQAFHDGLLEISAAVRARFSDRQPSEEEMRAFLRDRLISEGRTPEEADLFMEQLGPDTA